MITVFQTDRGKIRGHNEDYGGVYTNRAGEILAVVADGMGGHLAGDVASRMATEIIEAKWTETDKFETPNHAEIWLKESVNEINERIYRHSLENEECQGMGTTLVAAICLDKFTTIASVGDSRCYIRNTSGFSQLTDDHSLVNELVKSGQISKEDAEHHPRKNVLLRALGTEPKVEIDIKTISFEEDDLLLLCSDGLTNKVSDAELNDILSSELVLEEKAAKLIHLANEYGGEDNITLAIIHNNINEKAGE